jgi:hypothetical protein
MHRCAVETLAELMMTEAAEECRLQDHLSRSIRGEEKRRSTAGRLGFRRAGTASDDLDWPRSLAVHWCDGQASKIRMQESRVKNSGRKTSNSSKGSRNGKVSRVNRAA